MGIQEIRTATYEGHPAMLFECSSARRGNDRPSKGVVYLVTPPEVTATSLDSEPPGYQTATLAVAELEARRDVRGWGLQPGPAGPGNAGQGVP